MSSHNIQNAVLHTGNRKIKRTAKATFSRGENLAGETGTKETTTQSIWNKYNAYDCS